MKKLLASFLATSVLLTACTSGPRDEKQAFIDATVEATCMIFEAENIFDPALEDAAKAIYENYGFDASDDVAMEALTTKYEEDEEVSAAIADALNKCAGDLTDALGDVDLNVDEAMMDNVDEAMMEDVDVNMVEEADDMMGEEAVVEEN